MEFEVTYITFKASTKNKNTLMYYLDKLVNSTDVTYSVSKLDNEYSLNFAVSTLDEMNCILKLLDASEYLTYQDRHSDE